MTGPIEADRMNAVMGVGLLLVAALGAVAIGLAIRRVVREWRR